MSTNRFQQRKVQCIRTCPNYPGNWNCADNSMEQTLIISCRMPILRPPEEPVPWNTKFYKRTTECKKCFPAVTSTIPPTISTSMPNFNSQVDCRTIPPPFLEIPHATRILQEAKTHRRCLSTVASTVSPNGAAITLSMPESNPLVDETPFTTPVS